jgi:probable HAF family extracellular repeat protein
MSGLQFARGILYEHGTLRQFTTYESSFEPYAINDKSQIVGLDGYRGFSYENDRVTQIGTLSSVPVGNRSTARALNSHGQVVGWSTVNSRLRVVTGELPTHAFLWQRGAKSGRRCKRHDSMHDLGTLPGWINSYAYGINNQSEVVGSVSDSTGGTGGVDIDPADTDGRAEAFLWRNGTMTGLGTLPGGRDSEAYGINDGETIVGRSGGNAVVWQAGKIRDLNSLLPAGSGWVLQEARAINRKGQIVGIGTLAGKPHSFLLTPR